MKVVIELDSYIHAAADAGLDEDAMAAIVDAISATPDMGDVMPGTGGARKFRWARKNQGKSGGYRIISYYPGAEHVYLIDVFAKNEKANLTQAERNVLKNLVAGLE